ncbi:MAG: serine/threonine-protein phosphatase [Akkermansia sp.]|nr:serine/threonine-protein phosphatase [Akkermansia sp.]
MNAVIAQWIGKREHQEDSYLVRHYPAGTLAVLCDGMGGHQFGALASSTAAKEFVDAFEGDSDSPVSQRLLNALEAANAAVRAAFSEVGAYGGTTLVAAYIGGGVLWWVSVGDSPLYLWRHHRLIRLNEDHSMRAVYMQYVQSGCLTFEEAVMRGHALRSAVTGEAISMIDSSVTPYPLLPGDRIILTSDGTDDLLYTSVLADDVKALLDERSGNLAVRITEACRLLENPYADNVTVVSMDWDA